MEAMRIALISMHTSPAAVPGSGDAGGMNVVVAEAARALAERGHEVVAATRATAELPPGEYSMVDRRSTPRHNTARPAPVLVALAAGDPALRKERLPAVVPEFAAGLRGLGPFDAVHAHYWLSGCAAREAFERPFAMTFHTLAAQKNARLAPGDAPEPEARVAAERELAAASFVVAGSRSELDAVERSCGPLLSGSAIVHPGVDTALFAPRPPGTPSPDRTPSLSRGADDSATPATPLRVTVLGRVQPLKGQDLAVRTLAALAALDPQLAARTELVIAGEPTPGAEGYAAHLRELAATEGLADRVRFLPAQTREESAALLASSDVVLVPSHSETFGLTALEAAACGVPVIVGGHTGLVEAAPAGTAGVHMVDRDPHRWAEALAALLGDPARRAALGRSARAHALEHDWRAHAAALERIYCSLA